MILSIMKKSVMYVGLAVVVVLIIGFTLVFDKIGKEGIDVGENMECNIAKTERQFVHEKYYEGPLIDTHVHMPVSSKIISFVATSSGFEDMPPYDDELTIDYIACLFESEGIEKAFGFNVAPSPMVSESISRVKANKERYPDRFVHFYQPTQLPFLNPSPKRVDRILSKNSDLYQGYGEVKFSFHEIDNYGIHDQEYLEAYELAEKHNLIIMMHPGPQHKEEVKFLLEKHPSVNFLLHGGEIDEWIVEVLEDYDNAYYTIEPNIYILGWSREHDDKGPTKEEFLRYMNNNFDIALDDELRFWKTRIEENPDKFLWGTDRWFRWHFDVEVGKLVEEFGRSFIGELNPEVQEKFAYKNAEKIFL
jgi:predicted TIM-barrel fold metal-dependent hydrolase